MGRDGIEPSTSGLKVALPTLQYSEPHRWLHANRLIPPGIAKRRASRADVAIALTPTEWSILQTLAQHAGRSRTHQQIYDEVWGRPFGNPQQYLRVFVTHLRRKIERSPANPRIIITEPNVGYRFGET